MCLVTIAREREREREREGGGEGNLLSAFPRRDFISAGAKLDRNLLSGGFVYAR